MSVVRTTGPEIQQTSGSGSGSGPSALLRIGDLTKDDLEWLLELAALMKLDPVGEWSELSGRVVAGLFEKPSTRTRVSTAVAAQRLGMHYLELPADELQLSRGESLADTSRVLSSFVDALVIRTYRHTRLQAIAESAAVPVVNALSDTHHPCQALTDLLTLRERFGELRSLKVAFVGDASSNICHSLMEACALVGISLVIATPDQYRPDPEILTNACRVAAGLGGSVSIVNDPGDAVRDAHAVYPEVWVPMDREHERAERVRVLSDYQVDERLMELADCSGILLHCLPAHRGEEVSAGVLDGARSLAWQQAANRLPTAQAILYALLTGGC